MFAFQHRRSSAPQPTVYRASVSVEGIPPPDYIATPDEDPTLQVPPVIHYDDWRGSAGRIKKQQERFPPPPPQLLEDDDTFPEPPPDYEQNAQEEQENPGLIPPHKIPNPVLESRDRVQLNKDIIFNAKHNINVLDKKPELQKELLRRKLEKQKKEDAERQISKRSSFEQKLDARKEKLDNNERAEKILEEKEENQSELARVHNKIKAKHNH